MPIVSTNPTAPSHPEIAYDRLGVSLAVSPIWQASDVEAAVSITAIPYRVLPDGSIDKRPDLQWTFSTGQAFADSANDPALAAAATSLMTAIQTFLAAKGA